MVSMSDALFCHYVQISIAPHPSKSYLVWRYCGGLALCLRTSLSAPMWLSDNNDLSTEYQTPRDIIAKITEYLGAT